MNKLITAKNIVKTFGAGAERRKVLDNISIEISEGEFVSVMGPSGSGKTTLMFALSGMDRIDGGEVSFDGRDIAGFKEDELADIRRTKMGFVFQQPTLLKNLNVFDNIILPSMIGNRRSVDTITAKARLLMGKTGILELEGRDVTEASGGQLQRAGICRALMSSPKIIFGDEPTGALNSKSADDVMNILAEINTEGTAVMLVTHDARVAARSRRIMFMLDGKIVDEMRFSSCSSTNIDSRTKQVVEKMREIGV